MDPTSVGSSDFSPPNVTPTLVTTLARTPGPAIAPLTECPPCSCCRFASQFLFSTLPRARGHRVLAETWPPHLGAFTTLVSSSPPPARPTTVVGLGDWRNDAPRGYSLVRPPLPFEGSSFRACGALRASQLQGPFTPSPDTHRAPPLCVTCSRRWGFSSEKKDSSFIYEAYLLLVLGKVSVRDLLFLWRL